ncbi:MAG: LytTR family transcriptional regulator DNA-binding domain-containing protein [Acutalibacteraceae bacterium]|nr:LytTR family transcriptional regulator DNA-binding domain-containing protein [Acutalibacteraceae bacterium]
MKFKIFIDKEKEEEIIATVHKRTKLVDEIEALVLNEDTADEIAGYDEDGIVILKLETIEAFYIENSKTYAVCIDKNRYRVKSPLYELEKILPSNFQKLNKSNIANMKHIVRFKTLLNGAVDAEFKSGFTDYISRRCFAELKRRYSL